MFAASKSASSGTLKTVTFTSNGTWVAPATVSNVTTISGNGSNGVSDYVTTIISCIFGAFRGNPSPANAPYAQWSDNYGDYTNGLSTLSGLTYPTWGPALLPRESFTLVNSSDQWRNTYSTTDLSSYYLTGYSTNASGPPPTSGNILYSSLPSSGGLFWSYSIQGYVAGNAGTAATGLGKTFPGGSYTGSYPNGVGGTAPTTTFTNVAVTPGASYSIVVPSGGSLTITYIG